MHDDLRELCRGRWPSILIQIGISHASLTGKNVPCPMCRGKDRFRFSDRDGSGSWYCNRCGQSGEGGMSNGFGLVMRFKGVNFVGARNLVAEVVGVAKLTSTKPRPKYDTEHARERMKAMWQAAEGLTGADPASWYLVSRSLDGDKLPPSSAIRFLRSVRDIHPSGMVMQHAAMVARYIAPDDSRAILHLTFLTPNGEKADTWKVKRFPAGVLVPDGGAVRLFDVAETMGVATGIETSLAISELHQLPVWATLTDVGLMKFVPPQGVKQLRIFGDRDAKFGGQLSAYSLARRLSDQRPEIRADPVFADPMDGNDWCDVLKLRKALAAASNVVRFKP